VAFYDKEGKIVWYEGKTNGQDYNKTHCRLGHTATMGIERTLYPFEGNSERIIG
jgi:hypothetical protein